MNDKKAKAIAAKKDVILARVRAEMITLIRRARKVHVCVGHADNYWILDYREDDSVLVDSYAAASYIPNWDWQTPGQVMLDELAFSDIALLADEAAEKLALDAV